MTYTGDDVARAFRERGKRRRARRRFYNTCKLCEQDARTEYAKTRTWERKARSTLKRHAKKLGISLDEMITDLGWDVERIAHEMEHHYQNGCTQCGHPYKEMEQGRGALTIDHWDRRLPPGYGSNTQIMCQTCNRAKGTMTPEEWNEYKRLWRLRDAFLKSKARDPFYGTMFEGQGAQVGRKPKWDGHNWG